MDSRTGLPVVGMVGAGQLARMTHQAAISLGQSLRVLAAAEDDGAALIAAATVVGDHRDLATLREFAKGVDVLTFDHEHVPIAHLAALVAEGVVVNPGPDALRYTQNKAMMRTALSSLDIPVPPWRPVRDAAGVAAFAAEYGWPVMVKTVTGGYDGRGVFELFDFEETRALLAGGLPAGSEPSGGAGLLVEQRVALRRELAVQVARSPWGQIAVYPVVQTVQRDGICVEVLAPAPSLDEPTAHAAQRLAIRIAAELDVVGLLAVELFECGDGLLVNELAMRPHNSGHWSIEGARTSQFEQHLRAVLDYPLGEPSLTAPAVVTANVLGGPPGGMGLDERLHHLFAADPGVRVHLYGKQVRPGRKIGHVTVLGGDHDSLRRRAARAARWLREGTDG